MQNRLRAALGNNQPQDDHTLASFKADMHATLSYLGLNARQAEETGSHIIRSLLQDKPLAEIEREIFCYLSAVIVEAASGCSMIDAIGPKLEGRAELIFNQLRPYLKQHCGQRILDFGAGDGAVTQLIHDNISVNTLGIDVRPYPKPGLKVPLSIYSGGVVPYPDASFDCIVSTNVLHHPADNQQCVSEFKRLLKPRASAIIIETVPVGEAEEEALRNWELTFLNDYLFNRLFHDADVPVQGAFETFQGWIRRLTQAGFVLKAAEDFGIDQQIIRDRHVLLHIEKCERRLAGQEDLGHLAPW